RSRRVLVTPTPPTSGSEALAAPPRIVPFTAPPLQGALSSSSRHDALLEAHERAIADGRQAGMEIARQEAAELRARLSRSIDTADAAAKALREAALRFDERETLALRDFERAACELAVELAEAVLGWALEQPGAVVAALHDALRFVPRRDITIVKVHPDDVDVVRAALDDVDLPDGSRVVSDTGIGRGRCVLDVGPARIDLQVEGAMERVRAVVAGLTGPSLTEDWS
ncbi:MAG: FliH/SctL family protein, partial [Ilumatobacteraceae bacterium]